MSDQRVIAGLDTNYIAFLSGNGQKCRQEDAAEVKMFSIVGQVMFKEGHRKARVKNLPSKLKY
jgi:hypothetical protein